MSLFVLIYLRINYELVKSAIVAFIKIAENKTVHGAAVNYFNSNSSNSAH